jgi:gamma-glutamyltranspeptidase / glutathione hydrolase
MERVWPEHLAERAIAAVAAGHPATVDAGVEILRAGGSAADAAVAASLASCVAETVMTGLLGGGHAIYYDAGTGRAENLDFFVAVPGLGAERRDAELLELEVPFGTELVHYAVGIASCGVPGVPAGLEELRHRHGRLDWPRLVEPALRLARSGVEMPPAHASCLAMLAPVMTMNEGGRIYAPGGNLLATGDRLDQPGLARALELLAVEGPASAYTGSIAGSLLELVTERGGLVTEEDLRSYRAAWSEPVVVDYREWSVHTRGDLSGLPELLPHVPRLAGLDEADRALALARTLGRNGAEGGGDTTNITVVDHDGNACVLTTSLGLGSGDFLPGLDVHLNSMLGETDLLRGDLQPGDRMGSMMAPSVLVRDGALELAIGAAGGTRLRGALVQVTAGLLDECLSAADAVGRPRLHAANGRVQVEPGFSGSALGALERAGFDVRVWPARHHFFGGVSLVTPSDAAGDPRRSGAAVRLPSPTTS